MNSSLTVHKFQAKKQGEKKKKLLIEEVPQAGQVRLFNSVAMVTDTIINIHRDLRKKEKKIKLKSIYD